jgi:hypothetical protein
MQPKFSKLSQHFFFGLVWELSDSTYSFYYRWIVTFFLEINAATYIAECGKHIVFIKLCGVCQYGGVKESDVR